MAVHATILAGGAGTRLWPRSRLGQPKHLLALQKGSAPLLRQTYERVRSLVDEVHVVTELSQLGQHLANAVHLTQFGDDMNFVDQRPDALVGLPKQGSAAFLQCKQVLGLSPTRSRPEPCAGSAGKDRRVNRHGWSWSDLTHGASMRV